MLKVFFHVDKTQDLLVRKKEKAKNISIVCRPKLVKRFLCCCLTVPYSNTSVVCLETLVKWLVYIINFISLCKLAKVFCRYYSFLQKTLLSGQEPAQNMNG